MISQKINKLFYSKIIILLGLIYPFFFVNYFENTMVFDINFFKHFSNCFGVDIYIDTKCEPFGDTIFFMPNYPMLGLLFTSGFFKFFDFIINENNYIQIFRNYLAIFDSINIFLFYKILKLFKIKNSELKAFLFALLPSTLISGSAFGQIDHLLITFGLLTTYFLFISSIKIANREKGDIKYFSLSVISFFILLFVKQHSVLLLPYFFFLYLFILLVIIKFSKSNLYKYFLTFFLIFLVFLFIDISIFEVPDNFSINSVYIHTLVYGMGAASVISLFGMNFWSILDKFGFDIFHSQNSQIGSFFISEKYNIEIIPYSIGLIFSILLILYYVKNFFYLIINQKLDRNYETYKKIFVLSIGFNCLIILIYCNFMTGINIRYISQFYAYSLLFAFTMQRFSYFYIFLLMLSSIIFSSILAETIGLKFINQFFPLFENLNQLSIYPKMTDMQIIGFITNIFILIYLANKINFKIKYSHFYKYLITTLALIMIFDTIVNKKTSNYDIEISTNETFENFYLYYDNGKGFTEKNKISFKKNSSKNNIYILKLDTNIIGHIKSFRLDSPEIKNYNFEIIKFEKDDKNIMDNFEITLKNMIKKNDIFYNISNDDPYLIFTNEDKPEHNIPYLYYLIFFIIFFEFIFILRFFYLRVISSDF